MKRLKQIAKDKGEVLEQEEGANHTKVRIGDRKSTVPRHNEVNELTAKGIIKHFEKED